MNEVLSAPAAAAALPFDIAEIEDVETAEVQLKRNGQPMPIWVTMAGPEHPKRKQFDLARSRRMRKQLSKTGKVDFGDPLEDETEQTELLASCVLGWRGMVFKGAVLECNRTNVLMVLNDTKRAWLKKSIREVFDDNEAFIVTSDVA